MNSIEALNNHDKEIQMGLLMFIVEFIVLFVYNLHQNNIVYGIAIHIIISICIGFLFKCRL
jgi:hypothetical protein